MPITHTQGVPSDRVYNALGQGTAKALFSNIPVVIKEEDNASTVSLELTIKSTRLPQLSAEMTDLHYMHATYSHPVGSFTYNGDVSISFVVDDKMDNYFVLFKWLNMYKKHDYSPKDNSNIPGKPGFTFRHARCEELTVRWGDNILNIINSMVFYRARIKSLSPLSVVFNSAESVTVDATFAVDDMRWDRYPDDTEDTNNLVEVS